MLSNGSGVPHLIAEVHDALQQLLDCMSTRAVNALQCNGFDVAALRVAYASHGTASARQRAVVTDVPALYAALGVSQVLSRSASFNQAAAAAERAKWADDADKAHHQCCVSFEDDNENDYLDREIARRERWTRRDGKDPGWVGLRIKTLNTELRKVLERRGGGVKTL